MKKKVFSLMAVLMFVCSILNANTQISLDEYDEPCIAIAFAIEEEIGYEFSYEAFAQFVDSCKKWPIWNDCGCVLIQ